MTNDASNESQRTIAIMEWVGGLGSLGFVGAAGIFVYQIFLWLKEGQWTPIPISSILGTLGLDYDSVTDISWAGVQRIFVWLLDIPLSLGVIAFGCVAGVVVGQATHWVSTLRHASQ